MPKNSPKFILLLAFIAIIINYLDRSALAYAIEPLERSFHLTNSDFGIIASAFGIGYLIMTPIGGILVDRFGARKLWSISAFIWSVICTLLGAVTGFTMLFILRFLLGAAEGPGFPAFSRVTTDWVPTEKRARALSIGLVAVPLASVIGAPLVSYLILLTNWRVMFVILGIFGIIWAVVWHISFRDHPDRAAQRQQPAKTSWKFIFTNPSLLANNFAFFTFGYLLFFALIWLPGYYEQMYQIKLKTIPLFVTLPWILGAILILVGAALSDWLWQKTKNIRIARSHQIWICQLLSAACFIPVLQTHSLMISVIFVSLGIALGLMPNAAFYALNADLAQDRTGTSIGIMDAWFAVAGIIAPALTGFLTHISGNFNSAFLLLMILSGVSALGVFVLQRPVIQL